MSERILLPSTAVTVHSGFMAEVQPTLSAEADTAAFIAYLRDFPPQVHESAPTGVWAMAEDAIEFIVKHVSPETTSLETGCGASTAAFVWRGARHQSMFLDKSEGDALAAWLDRAGLAHDRLELVPGSSTETLPQLVFTQPGVNVDFFVVDGCHAFPFPMVDWYFGAKLVKRGGIVLVDDVQLPAPRQLADFLSADPRWSPLERTLRWAAFRKEDDWAHDEEWTSQLFYRPQGQWLTETKIRVNNLLTSRSPRRLAYRIKRRLLGR